MKKSDLKDFMIIVTREGSKYIFCTDPTTNLTALVHSEGYLWMNDYDEDMDSIDGEVSFDIMKVYVPKGTYHYQYCFNKDKDWENLDGAGYKLLWNRENAEERNELLEELSSLENELADTINTVQGLQKNLSELKEKLFK